MKIENVCYKIGNTVTELVSNQVLGQVSSQVNFIVFRYVWGKVSGQVISKVWGQDMWVHFITH